MRSNQLIRLQSLSHSSNLLRVVRLAVCPHRTAKSWIKREEKRQHRDDTVYQYAGKYAERADRVYVWGYAATGALGIKKYLKPERNENPRKIQLTPVRHTFFPENDLEVRSVACGYGFSLFICDAKKKSILYGTGINTDSQLGFQEYPINTGRILDYVIQPAEISLPLNRPGTTKIHQVACGRAHSVILTDEGVFSIGNNAHGQCGRKVVPQEKYRGSQTINRIELDKKVVHVECGQDHTLLLTEDGEVYSCGMGADGQTGAGHYGAVEQPTRVRGDIDGERITHISSKADCVLAVSDKGEVFGWGNSEYNQLSCVSEGYTQVNTARHLPFTGVGRLVQAAAAGSMCAILNDEGDVFVWGYGILGKGHKLDEKRTPTSVPPTLFGKNEFNPDTKVTHISCGITHFTALTNGGSLYSWGRNHTAVLGLGHVKDQYFPFKVIVPAEVRSVACGVDHTIVLTKAFA